MSKVNWYYHSWCATTKELHNLQMEHGFLILHNHHQLFKWLPCCLHTNTMDSKHKSFVIILAIAKACHQHPQCHISLTKTSSNELLCLQMQCHQDVNPTILVMKISPCHLWPSVSLYSLSDCNPFDPGLWWRYWRFNWNSYIVWLLHKLRKKSQRKNWENQSNKMMQHDDEALLWNIAVVQIYNQYYNLCARTELIYIFKDYVVIQLFMEDSFVIKYLRETCIPYLS